MAVVKRKFSAGAIAKHEIAIGGLKFSYKPPKLSTQGSTLQTHPDQPPPKRLRERQRVLPRIHVLARNVKPDDSGLNGADWRNIGISWRIRLGPRAWLSTVTCATCRLLSRHVRPFHVQELRPTMPGRDSCVDRFALITLEAYSENVLTRSSTIKVEESASTRTGDIHARPIVPRHIRLGKKKIGVSDRSSVEEQRSEEDEDEDEDEEEGWRTVARGQKGGEEGQSRWRERERLLHRPIPRSGSSLLSSPLLSAPGRSRLAFLLALGNKNPRA
ncbi:hypothetical protein KM043_003572 [Ampulex compressa]|nr:hypothetical protein KM043_003572 [Ampulex compressa]